MKFYPRIRSFRARSQKIYNCQSLYPGDATCTIFGKVLEAVNGRRTRTNIATCRSPELLLDRNFNMAAFRKSNYSHVNDHFSRRQREQYLKKGIQNRQKMNMNLMFGQY